MCGIVGLYQPAASRADIAQRLSRMTDAIVHRGPDDEGFFAADSIGLGMRRLSIIDVAGGQQPISNEDGTIQVVSNGEIYNHRDLRSRLESRHQFRCQTDTEAIVHLYEEMGVDCFRDMRGMFGTAIWDSQRQRLVLGRDRLGKKPLYYAQVGDQLLFGSEIKSLLAVEPSLREPDYTRLGEYFQFGFLCEPNTFYRRIKKLPAGHFAVYENGQLQIQSYWDLNFEPDHSRSWEDWAEELDTTLLDSVKVRLESEVPLGVFLSGGIDSSAIVAYAHAAGLDPLKTFTIAFDRPEWDESADARRVAEHFDTQHHELRLSEPEMRNGLHDMLVQLTHHFDEPFGDDSALPTHFVSKLAREHVTVILSGDGGDELFAGYSAYQGALFGEMYRRWLPGPLGRSLAPSTASLAAKVMPGNLRYKMQRVAKVFRDSSRPLLDSIRDKSSIWNRREIERVIDPDVLGDCALMDEQYLPSRLWKILGDSSRDVVSRLTETDIHSYMRDDILMKVDRMSMANSLEVRSPLLDHHVAELAARMPTEVKLRRKGFGWQGKAILKEVLKRRLPSQTMRKKKQGFAVPLRDWFRDGLSDLVGDFLLYNGGRLPAGVMVPTEVERVVKEHQSGRVDHGRKIWLLLSLAAWNEIQESGVGAPTNDSFVGNPQ